MSIDTALTAFIIIIFLAALTRSTFGFGDALIAMPLAALFFPLITATPIVAFSGLYISIVILVGNWKKIKIKMIWQLVLFSVIGIPLGVLLLRNADDTLVKTALGVILILFAIYKIFNFGNFKLKNEKSSFLFGLVSGILGGAYNANGPPIIIYGSLRRWSPDEFRVILQGIFLPTNLFIIIGHGAAGLWTKTVFYYFLLSLPVITLAMFIGNKLNLMIPKDKFEILVYWLLLIIGCVLLINIYF